MKASVKYLPIFLAAVAQRMIAEQMLEMEKPVKIPLLRKGVDVVFDCTRI